MWRQIGPSGTPWWTWRCWKEMLISWGCLEMLASSWFLTRAGTSPLHKHACHCSSLPCWIGVSVACRCICSPSFLVHPADGIHNPGWSPPDPFLCCGHDSSAWSARSLWTIYNIVLVLGPPCCYCLACVPNVDLLAFLAIYGIYDTSRFTASTWFDFYLGSIVFISNCLFLVHQPTYLATTASGHLLWFPFPDIVSAEEIF